MKDNSDFKPEMVSYKKTLIGSSSGEPQRSCIAIATNPEPNDESPPGLTITLFIGKDTIRELLYPHSTSHVINNLLTEVWLHVK